MDVATRAVEQASRAAQAACRPELSRQAAVVAATRMQRAPGTARGTLAKRPWRFGRSSGARSPRSAYAKASR
jgi:hypothetical protein